MKQIILSLFLISLFGCTKDHTPTLKGEWKLTGWFGCYYSEVSCNLSLRFKSNGEFIMDSSNQCSYIMNELRGLNRYVVKQDSVLFYNQNTNDTIVYHYNLDNDLAFSFMNVRYLLNR